jgi:hypothetical protein
MWRGAANPWLETEALTDCVAFYRNPGLHGGSGEKVTPTRLAQLDHA